MSAEQSMFYHPSIFQAYPEIIAAGSTRLGGVSEGDYASLNLGLNTDDRDAAVLENRRRFFQALGLTPEQVASAHQIHGDAVLHVQTPGRREGYDALICNQPGIFLAVTVADCTPILIFDPVKHAVAAVHAGWRGTVSRILKKTLQQMQAVFGTDPQDCLAYIGTCIDACSYEVDADVAQHFNEPFVQWSPAQQKYLLDLKQANKAQLLETGLSPDHIEVSPYSTVLHNDLFFSYRKEKGSTGRMLNGIGLRT